MLAVTGLALLCSANKVPFWATRNRSIGVPLLVDSPIEFSHQADFAVVKIATAAEVLNSNGSHNPIVERLGRQDRRQIRPITSYSSDKVPASGSRCFGRQDAGRNDRWVSNVDIIRCETAIVSELAEPYFGLIHSIFAKEHLPLCAYINRWALSEIGQSNGCFDTIRPEICVRNSPPYIGPLVNLELLRAARLRVSELLFRDFQSRLRELVGSVGLVYVNSQSEKSKNFNPESNAKYFFLRVLPKTLKTVFFFGLSIVFFGFGLIILRHELPRYGDNWLGAIGIGVIGSSALILGFVAVFIAML